ncbi:MAG: MFS transporter [Candidatus Bathyarchaeota archaeon]|nr:MFS transporter [Candidatus Bathyarchaeota archaeon]
MKGIWELKIGKGTFFGLGSFQFLSFMRRGIFYSFMYIYLFSLLGRVTTATALGTFTMLMSAVGQNLLWGRISDRYRLRTKLVVIGELIAGFTYIIVFLVHRSLLDGGRTFDAGLAIIAGLSLLEFFWSMSDVGWAALLTDVTIPRTRGGLIGAFNFLASIGRMTGVLIAGFLYGGGSGFKEGTIFYVVVIMLFIGVAIMWQASKSIKKQTRQSWNLNKEKAEPTLDQKRSIQSSNERTFFWFLVSLTIVVLGAASINQIFLFFLQLEEGLAASDVEVSLIVAAWTVGGMTASVVLGKLSDRIGRVKVIMSGLILATIIPLLYGFVSNVGLMATIYGLSGLSFMTIRTVGFAFAGDIIPENKRGRLLSRFNTVMALSWGPAGFLIGGPFADLQTEILKIPTQEAYINAFFVSSLLVFLGMSLFFVKIRKKSMARKS